MYMMVWGCVSGQKKEQWGKSLLQFTTVGTLPRDTKTCFQWNKGKENKIIIGDISALIPTATAGLAARFGARAAAGASMLLYAGSGVATEVVLENINNPETTVEDKRWAAFEGAVSSIVGYKAGEAVSLLPIMKRMERALQHWYRLHSAPSGQALS